MPKKAPIDVTYTQVVGDGYVERAQEAINRLREMRKPVPPWSEVGVLRVMNSLFTAGAKPKEWKSKLTAAQFNACLERAKEYDPAELKAAVQMILASDSVDFQNYLCYPWISMDGEHWDLPFWETAMCMVPKEWRKKASADYWAFPLFN